MRTSDALLTPVSHDSVAKFTNDCENTINGWRSLEQNSYEIKLETREDFETVLSAIARFFARDVIDPTYSEKLGCTAKCPCCDAHICIVINDRYCTFCGQKLRWGAEAEQALFSKTFRIEEKDDGTMIGRLKRGLNNADK